MIKTNRKIQNPSVLNRGVLYSCKQGYFADFALEDLAEVLFAHEDFALVDLAEVDLFCVADLVVEALAFVALEAVLLADAFEAFALLAF